MLRYRPEVYLMSETVDANKWSIFRCAEHQRSGIIPQLCHICQRIDVERKIEQHAVAALVSAGFCLAVDDGGDVTRYPSELYTLPKRAELINRVCADLATVDIATLLVWSPAETRQRFVQFVHGNDGYDVISDYSSSLETFLADTNAYAQRFEV